MKSLICVALLSTILVAADKPRDAGDQGRRKLQGTWQVLEERHGDADPDEEGKLCQFIFEGDKLTITKEQKVIIEGTFTVDAGKTPPQIDIKVIRDDVNPNAGQTALGIYKIDGDKLKWCSAGPGRDDRPTEFVIKGTDYLLVTMERVKKVK